MPNETRVNLQHLLEDIRDSYALPIEEVIVTELIANALDSRASRIDFRTDASCATIVCTDNGVGMRRQALREYHNIAATTKERGRGIGFAGIGAKLSLLVAELVTTETRGGRGSRAATEWRLTNPNRAPWKFIPAPGLVSGARGTAVQITLTDQSSALLGPDFLAATIYKHFYPLLSPAIHKNILKFVYKHGVIFSINDTPLTPGKEREGLNREFLVYLGARNRRPIGYGILTKDGNGQQQGIEVSTYGKVIKRGWEWLGIYPKAHDRISGIVEIPGLAEILTTNKTDFLNDTASLKKYYRYRKAIQEAIVPILREFGEDGLAHEATTQGYKSLQRDIEDVLETLLNDFPEIQPLLKFRPRGRAANAAITEPSRTAATTKHEWGVKTEPIKQETTETEAAAAVSPATLHATLKTDPQGQTHKTVREPGLKIGFEEDPSSLTLGRLVEDTAWINTAHPAWRKAKTEGLETYHILHAIAWILSTFIEPDRAPHEFVSKFLSAWGASDDKTQQLFRLV